MEPLSCLSEAEREVWEVIVRFNRAFASNNPAEYFTYIHPEIVVLTPGNPYRVEGLVADREEFEFNLKKGSGLVGYFQELHPHIRVLGSAAVVTYYSRGSYGPEGQARTLYLKETDVLEKTPEGWKIVHIHVSAG